MTDRTDRMPMVRLATLRRFEKKDGTGSYFTGYMGQTKVLLFKDKQSPEGKEQWNLLVQEQSQEEKDRFRQWKDGNTSGRTDPQAPVAKPNEAKGGFALNSPPNTALELNDEVPF